MRLFKVTIEEVDNPENNQHCFLNEHSTKALFNDESFTGLVMDAKTNETFSIREKFLTKLNIADKDIFEQC